jgi:hypothetical protein
MNTLLEVELNQMRYDELLAEAERVRLARRAKSGDGAGRSSIVQWLALSLKGIALRKVVRRVLSPAANG